MIPRRSVLYLPASNARALEKAASLDCDAVIFDLEDAVAASEKTTARDRLAAAMAQHDYGAREKILRVNGLDTPWGVEDCALAARVRFDAVLFPKVDSGVEVSQLIETLDRQGVPDLPIWLMIETPRAVLAVAEIAAASPRVSCLVLGTSDLVTELRARHTVDRANLACALQYCVLGARAAGVDVLDGVHLNFRDQAAFESACVAARDMGFDGKTLIHPSQVETANAVFGLDGAAVENAERVLAAWHEAQAQGKGVAELDGRLIENLHAAEAERVLSFAEALRARSQ